jgi:hypothetical protein
MPLTAQRWPLDYVKLKRRTELLEMQTNAPTRL